MWSIAPLRAQRSSGGHLGEPQASTVGGSCAWVSQGHGTKCGTTASPTGTRLWLQACSVSWGQQRDQSMAQGQCKGVSTERGGCKGSVRLVSKAYRISHCWICQRGETGLARCTSTRKSSLVHGVTRFWFRVLSPEPGQGTGCRQGRVS